MNLAARKKNSLFSVICTVILKIKLEHPPTTFLAGLKTPNQEYHQNITSKTPLFDIVFQSQVREMLIQMIAQSTTDSEKIKYQ